MNTPSDNTNVVAQEDEQPVNSFTRMIEAAPSTASFGGWGPKVIGLTSSLTRWN
ncbi:MAG: hypothetical protein JO322_06275 [Candidatus Eremiobacteraeota bacterium]|nr:hypothetical protein [Candidatus Eremiobacteraeota bacterium]